jgi:hypothetical protein
MSITFRIGPDVISSYRRLSYTPWHALAEFVDNSTQSYTNNRAALDKAYTAEGEGLEVSISYDKDSGLLRIADNAMGMTLGELEEALHVARRPKVTTGRSKYGMGMKTAACWLGEMWTVRTKKLGSDTEFEVTINVAEIAKGNVDLNPRSTKVANKSLHYTVVEVTSLLRVFRGRTLGKIRDYLRSMYREDFRNKSLQLMWNGAALSWEEVDEQLASAEDGKKYKKQFKFAIDGKMVEGFVGILARGSRAKAGFSILHGGRVVRGWPDAWRPESIFGQLQGSNDLVNQRVVGEVHLDAFDVSHTKDDILWVGDEEEEVEKELLKHCGDYKEVAKKMRKGVDERGPSTVETEAAVEELQRELSSPEFVDAIALEQVPPPDVIRRSFDAVIESQKGRQPRFSATTAGIAVKGYLMDDRSENDPYYVCDSTKPSDLVVVINQAHPHWTQLKGSDGVLNYLRHCTYDALAEHQARHKAAALDADTIKLLKDKFLRVPFDIEMHSGEEESQ